MKLPYRNIPHHQKNKPKIIRDPNPEFPMLLPGIKYQKNNTCFEKCEMGCGEYIHALILKENMFTDLKNKDKDKILVLKTKEDILKFASIYTTNKEYLIVKKEKLMKDFAGLEINNYFKIKKELTLKERQKNTWFSVLDIECLFNTIWNEDVIKEIKYFGKYK